MPRLLFKETHRQTDRHRHTQSFAIVGQVQFIQDGSLRQLFTITYIIVTGYYRITYYKTDNIYNTSVNFYRQNCKTSQNQDTTLLQYITCEEVGKSYW